MQNDNENELKKLIRPLMMMSRLVTFWPLSKESGLLTRKFRVLHRYIMGFLLFTMVFAVTSDGIKHRHDIDEATECGLIGATFYLSTLRLLVFSTHQKEMYFIVKTMREDWCTASAKEIKILRQKCQFSYKIANFFITSVAISLVFFIFIPIMKIYVLHETRETLPLRGYFYINHTISPVFECVFVINIAACVLSTGTIVAGTSFALISVIHSAAKFSLLQKKLKRVKGSDPSADEIVKECIVQHQACIEFAEELEKVISPLALGQFVISTGMLCFSGFQICTNKGDHEKLLKYCTFLPTAILELFLFSYSGNQLIEESRAIGESVYFSDWVGSTYVKNLQIIMMRVNNPSKITAVKFYDLSLETFSTVLRTSFSYFTVLQAVNE